jgi:outer membrane protein
MTGTRLPSIARRWLPAALALACLATAARGEDLLQIYREAQKQDPTIASARSQWEATQENVPQARSTLLPQVSAQGQANANNYDATVNTTPKLNVSQQYGFGNLTFSASQPLYRPQNVIALDQAREQVVQSDFTLGIAQQDLIIRTATAYFDVLLAEYNVELAQQQLKAVSEQLAQAKRNFEVGTATITDTNEAQAKHDQITATEIQAENDLDNRRTALMAIIGRMPKSLKRVGAGFEPPLPDPNNVDYWVNRALKENLSVRSAQSNYDIAALEVDRARAGHLPTLDAVASAGWTAQSGSTTTDLGGNSRQQLFGIVLNVPIYTGGFVNSRVRQAISLQDKARADLEFAKRTAVTNAQDGFTGVKSAAASVKAFGQAVASAEVALQSNILGQEVGIRTNLDVLNVQQDVYSTRRDLANAYFTYLIAVLRLKSAIGDLTEQDLEAINRRLNG